MIGKSQASNAATSVRSGLTIVELLAATVLSVLLMTAVLGVLQIITRGQKSLTRDQTQEAWQTRVVELLAWDLMNSRTIRPWEQGFELDGFAGRNFGSGQPIHCRSLIRYTLMPSGDQFCLLRTEIHPDSLALDNQSVELVAFDVDQVWVVSAGSTVPSETESQPPPQPTTLDGDLPARLHVEIYRDSQETPLLAHDYVLR